MVNIYSAPAGNHTINSAVDVQISGGQYLGINLNLASDVALFGLCTATGTLSTLG